MTRLLRRVGAYLWANGWRAVCLLLLLSVATFEGYHAWRWKHVTDTRGWQAEQAYGYLATPIAGSQANRAKLLDALILEYAQRQRTGRH